MWAQTSQKDGGQAPVKYDTLVFFEKFNGVKQPDRWRAGKKETPLLPKKFFAWLIPLHDLDLLCLPDLINPWGLHIFAVIIRRGNPLKHIERRIGGGIKPGK